MSKKNIKQVLKHNGKCNGIDSLVSNVNEYDNIHTFANDVTSLLYQKPKQIDIRNTESKISATNIHMAYKMKCKNPDLYDYEKMKEEVTKRKTRSEKYILYIDKEMSIVGSLFSFSFDNCSCFFNKTKKVEKQVYQEKLTTLPENCDITVLPFMSFLPLTDIFPESSHVDEWSVYIIGKNKRLVVSQDNLKLADKSMLNKRYDHVLEGKNGLFFDTVFQMIIDGHETQFIMMIKDKMYFANTYTFKNENKQNIGGILFIRLYNSMTELTPISTEEAINVRKSQEYQRALQQIQKTKCDVLNSTLYES
jgi:hypothetical protein